MLVSSQLSNCNNLRTIFAVLLLQQYSKIVVAQTVPEVGRADGTCPCFSGFDYFQELRWKKEHLASSAECRGWYDVESEASGKDQLVKCSFLFDHIQMRQTLKEEAERGTGFKLREEECYSPDSHDCTFALRLFYRTVWLIRGSKYGTKCRTCHAECELGALSKREECRKVCNGTSAEKAKDGPACADGEATMWKATSPTGLNRRSLSVLGPKKSLLSPSLIRGIEEIEREHTSHKNSSLEKNKAEEQKRKLQDTEEEEKVEYEWPPCPDFAQLAVDTLYYYCGDVDVCYGNGGSQKSFDDITDDLKTFIESELQCSGVFRQAYPHILVYFLSFAVILKLSLNIEMM